MELPLFINHDLGNPLYCDILNEDLNEGLIKTYPPEVALRHLKDLFNLTDEQIMLVDSATKRSGDESKRIVVKVEKNKEKIESIKHAANLCGYILNLEWNTDEGVNMVFIPKYAGDVTDIVKKIGSLVHITPIYNKEKILKNGLSPKLKNTMFMHDGRVYFFPNDSRLNSEIYFQMQDFEKHLENKTNNGWWTAFIISVDRLKDVTFFYDTSYRNGIYTYDNIPPSAITGHGDVDLNKDILGVKEY